MVHYNIHMYFFYIKIKLLSSDEWCCPYSHVKYSQCNKNQCGDICKLSEKYIKWKKESEIIIKWKKREKPNNNNK